MRTSFAPKLPPVVADERSMRQIVLNLVSNAIKFTDAGGQVIVSTAVTDRGEVAFRVRDTGIGMTRARSKRRWSRSGSSRPPASGAARGSACRSPRRWWKPTGERCRSRAIRTRAPSSRCCSRRRGCWRNRIAALLHPSSALATGGPVAALRQVDDRRCRRGPSSLPSPGPRGAFMQFAFDRGRGDDPRCRAEGRGRAPGARWPSGSTRGEGREELLANLKDLPDNGFMALNRHSRNTGARKPERSPSRSRSRNWATPAPPPPCDLGHQYGRGGDPGGRVGGTEGPSPAAFRRRHLSGRRVLPHGERRRLRSRAA